MQVWQKDFFNNATLQNTSISITKDKIVWPLIVLVINDTAATDYKKDFNDDEQVTLIFPLVPFKYQILPI